MAPRIAVTGATGSLGGLVIAELIPTVGAARLVAVVRNPDKAAALARKGVQVRLANYSDPEALSSALQDVATLLLISSSEIGQRAQQHFNVVEAAKKCGVRHIVYTSAPHADTSTLQLAAEHKATEQLIRASGLTFSFLRNNWYHENYLPQVAPVAASGVLLGSSHGGRVASAARADYAAAAAVVLANPGHDNTVYELSGDVAWDYATLATVISEVTGKPVTYRDLSTAEHLVALKEQRLDEATAAFVAQLDADIAAGTLSDVTSDLSRLIGRPTTALIDTLRGAAV
jgi:NAD(P)H dehydrogenase (quinone)